MKIVFTILAILIMFSMFCAADHKERVLYTVSFVTTILGIVSLEILEFLK